ncbi:MAG: RsmB/NOP family class I SAM-dependent RNA methyltransferase [Sphingopyxis sp.]
MTIDVSATVTGLPARAAALKLLDAVLRRGEVMEVVAANATRGLTPSDRALSLAIANEVCRHVVDLDALIDSVTAQPLGHDLKARMVLRIALVQALVLKTPPHAAIATALPLVSGGPRRLVHGVFGTLMRGNVALPTTPTLPAPVTQRWRTAWGDAMVAGASAALAAPPPLDLTLADPAQTAHWAAALGGMSLMLGHIRLPRGGDITQISGYTSGVWWVQDLAAALPARLLGAGAGRSVLDVGAAPGGKTMQLAAAGWAVTALDTSERRLGRLRDNLARTRLSAEILRGDARTLPEGRLWDAALIDAPCSATGIFRRHPDVLHRIDSGDIVSRAGVQREMLDATAQAVRSGGTLVYAVCSLEPEEGEDVVTAFIADHGDWQIDPVAPCELPDGIVASPQGWVRTYPPMLEGVGGIDGFFMARLVRGLSHS